MSDLKIAVVVGSTRPGRKGRAVAEWVVAHAEGRSGTRYELVDLLDFPLPLLDEPLSAKATGPGGYTRDHTKAWAAKIAEYDGFVFVTPEYNHSLSGALKNAIDFLYEEWTNKAAALVGYGAAGGTRAIEHLRGILSEVQVAHVQQQLSFSAFTDFVGYRTPDAALAPSDIQKTFADTMFAQLETWAGALRPVREASATHGGAASGADRVR
uniref:NAD(P)H-dependent oxidoreductase n=1 Tax=Streptomyces sp. NBC_01401 TaxID=2903854 RepID=A0AAU3GYH1_9ACTN